MKIMTKSLTMQEAIEKGYTHFGSEEGERAIKFSAIKTEDIEYLKNKKCFLVDMKTPIHYTIDADTIKDLITDHVSGQEEVVDEDGKLDDIAAAHDYTKIAEELNEKFKEYAYYEILDIQVTF